MDSKMIAIAYLISLGVFFVILVIATIVVIAGAIKRKKKAKKAKKAKIMNEKYDDDTEDEAADISIFDEAVIQASSITTSEPKSEPVKAQVKVDNAPQQSAVDIPQVVPVIQDIPAVPASPEENQEKAQNEEKIDEAAFDKLNFVDEAYSNSAFAEDKELADSAFADSTFTDSAFAEDSAFTDSAFTDSAFVEDSAFTDSAFVETNYDGAAFPGSAFENLEPQAATTGYGQAVMNQTMTIGNFYWFNKEDVEDRPDYKPVEMYYRYFRTADECIEDLLTEMYDCALVRTEDIRYIAYGIEPRHVAMRDVAATGNAAYNASKKRKEPSKEDLDKIYRKWCSYVDKLFEIVEFHADNTTIGIIRDKLYEFGKSDVNTLIDGK